MTGWPRSTCTRTWSRSRSGPGREAVDPQDRVLEFRTFYGVLQEMARELRRRGVTHVVMEASGSTPSRCITRCAEQDFTEVR
jgi:hypothetical protein